MGNECLYIYIYIYVYVYINWHILSSFARPPSKNPDCKIQITTTGNFD